MKKLKIGIFGAGRGYNLSKNFMLLNCEIVALCDRHKERREASAKKLGGDVVCYESFDDFINHEMDAVIVANDFHEHAPFVIECFKRNIHVFCECTAAITIGEGVELIRAFEKSKSIYMIAENYPDMIFNREMKRLVDTGSLGKIVYAEGEYNHPVSAFDTKFAKEYVYYPEHWRNFLPRSYYVTHSLGPLMRITGATPKRVTAFNAYAPNTEDVPTASYVGDAIASINTLNDDGSVFRFTGCAKMGAHHNAYRIAGTKGQVENLRGMGNKVMLRYNEWDKPEGMPAELLYEPKWNDPDEHLIWQGGHGGGDFLTSRTFVEAVSEGKQPPHPYDIYSAVNMSCVAILAHRSALEGGMPYDVPDFHKEEERAKYENDHLTPFWGKNGEPPTLPCCSNPDYKPTEKQLQLYKEYVLDS